MTNSKNYFWINQNNFVYLYHKYKKYEKNLR